MNGGSVHAYDVIVCGGEIAGLVAAALLARRGFRVLLLGHEADRPVIGAGGLLLSRAPALLPPIEDPQSARVWGELDSTAHMKRRAAAVDPGMRLLLGERAIDLRRQGQGEETELTRAFGPSGATLATVAERVAGQGHLLDPLLASALTLPPHGFWERREVGRLESLLPRSKTDLYAPLGADHPFRTAVAAVATHASSLAPHEIRSVTEARAFAVARRGLHHFDGGLAGLYDFLLARLEMFGGEQRSRARPVEVVIRRGRVVGLRVQPRDEIIGCEFLVWAGSPTTIAPLLGGGKARDARVSGLRVAGYRYSISMLVDPEAIPAETPRHLIAVADPSGALMEDNAVSIVIGRGAPARPKPSAHVTNANVDSRVPVWIECPVPAHGVDAGPAYLRALRGRLIHLMTRLLPWAARPSSLFASAYDGLPAQSGIAPAAPIDAPPTDSSTQTESGIAPPPALFAPDGARPLDVLGLPHTVGIKNLYLVGRENLPGLGLEGELVSGWGAARLVSGRRPRRLLPNRRMLIG